MVIEVDGLTKSYGHRRVLDGVDLDVAKGTVLGLLGPNGAGKTTMVRILSTLARPDAGRVRVAGFDVLHQRGQVRRRIGVTGQEVALDPLQTGSENLLMLARLAGLSRPAARLAVARLLELFDLADAAGRRVATYSGGMRRRLDIAAGLVGTPTVVFLDEPTTGLDPRSRLATWALVRDLVCDGTTVFLTTQYLEEADQLADRVVVLDAGRVVADGAPAQLKQRYAPVRLDLTAADAAAYAAMGRRVPVVHEDPGRLVLGVATDGGAADVRAILDRADPGHTDVASFEVHRATLDDVFLALTGHTTEAKETADV